MEKKLTILFGTETGNAEMLAHDAATAAKSNGFAAEVRGMDEISVEELYKELNEKPTRLSKFMFLNIFSSALKPNMGTIGQQGERLANRSACTA